MIKEWGKKVNILLVDDDESFYKSLSFTLRKKGFNVDFASSFSEAIEKSKECNFDIALLDIKLPDKSGIELVKPLKEINPGMAIMMVTGYASLTTAVESVNLEITAYLTKPIEMERLLKTISEILEKQRLITRNEELNKQIQKELEERKLAEEKYRILVETSPNAILLLDIEGNIIFVNEQFLTMRGYENEVDVIGRSLSDFSHRDQNRLTEIIKEILTTKKSIIEREIILQRKDGSTFLAESYVSVVLNEQGEPIFLTAIQKDITERKKNENELAIQNQISHLFATIPDKEIYSELLNAVIIALKSKKGVFGYINEKGDLICPTLTEETWNECQILDKTIVFPQESWGDSLWTRAIIERKVLLSNEQSTKTPKGHNTPLERNLATPIIYQGEAIGILHVANKESDYTDYDIHLMKIISKHIAPILYLKLQKKIEEAQRKKAEWDREDAIKDLEKIFLYSPALIFTTSLDGYFKRINPAFCKTFGYSENELLASLFIDYVHPDDQELSLPNIGTLRSGLKTIKFINRFRCKNGEYKWIECISNPVVEDGITFSIAQDITDRKISEVKLIESEEKYRTFVETSPNGIMVADFNGIITFVNEQLVIMFGYNSIDDFLGKRFSDFVPAIDSKQIQNVRSFFDSSKELLDLQSIIKRKDGSDIYLDVSLKSIIDSDGKPTACLAFITDITSRKKSEEAIKESELRYRTIFKAAFDSIMVIKEYRFVDCNDVVVERYGFKSKDEFLGLSPWEISPLKQPDGRSSKQKALELLNAAYKGKPQRFYWQHETRNGRHFDVDVSLTYFEMLGERYLLVMWRDITEYRKAELALKESEELYRTVFESTGTAMLLTENRKVVVCNAKFLELFGYKREEIEGQMWTKWIYETDIEKLLRISISHQKNLEIFPMETEFKVTRADGEVRIVFAVIDLIPETLKSVISLQDITARKNLEEVRNQVYEQLERNLEQFAILVDSIRNPLAVIVGFADIYSEEITNKIIKQINIIDEIISELDLRALESLNVRNFLKKHT